MRFELGDIILYKELRDPEVIILSRVIELYPEDTRVKVDDIYLDDPSFEQDATKNIIITFTNKIKVIKVFKTLDQAKKEYSEYFI